MDIDQIIDSIKSLPEYKALDKIMSFNKDVFVQLFEHKHTIIKLVDQINSKPDANDDELIKMIEIFYNNNKDEIDKIVQIVVQKKVGGRKSRKTIRKLKRSRKYRAGAGSDNNEINQALYIGIWILILNIITMLLLYIICKTIIRLNIDIDYIDLNDRRLTDMTYFQIIVYMSVMYSAPIDVNINSCLVLLRRIYNIFRTRSLATVNIEHTDININQEFSDIEEREEREKEREERENNNNDNNDNDNV
jgi:hypothetical protein